MMHNLPGYRSETAIAFRHYSDICTLFSDLESGDLVYKGRANSAVFRLSKNFSIGAQEKHA
jgi:hypothetical protein